MKEGFEEIDKVECLEVTVVTKRSTSSDIRKFGDPPVLGPYKIIRKEGSEIFLKKLNDYLKTINKDHKGIDVDNTHDRPSKDIPETEESFEQFCDYLSNDENW
jgi:hypothetical protein